MIFFVSTGRFLRPAGISLYTLSKPLSPPPGFIPCFFDKCQSAGLLDVPPPLPQGDARDEGVLAAALDKVGRSDELRGNVVTTKLVVTPA